MKKYLSTGLIIFLPIALTTWILIYLLDLFTTPAYELLETYLLPLPLPHHAIIAHILSRLIALIGTLALIWLLGFLARRFFFQSFAKAGNKLIAKIPVIGTLYNLTKDLTKAMLSTDSKTFKEPVLFPFPSRQTHALGFVTASLPETLKTAAKGADVVVFVPTAPQPTSGYLLFAPKEMALPVDLSTEETFKLILSCGALNPEQKK